MPFNGRHPRNPCNYMDHYSFTAPEGWKAELAGDVHSNLIREIFADISGWTRHVEKRQSLESIKLSTE